MSTGYDAPRRARRGPACFNLRLLFAWISAWALNQCCFFFFNFFFSPFVLKTSCLASGRAAAKPGAARRAGSVLALPPRTQTPGQGIIWPGLRSPASAATIKRYLEELTGDSGAGAAGPRTRLGGEARARTRGNVTPARFLVQAGTMLEEGTIARFQVRRSGAVGGGHRQAGRFSRGQAA